MSTAYLSTGSILVQCEHLACTAILNFSLIFFRRDDLKQNYLLGRYWLEVNMGDLSSFDPVLADLLERTPAEYLPLVSRGLASDTSVTFLLVSGAPPPL